MLAVLVLGSLCETSTWIGIGGGGCTCDLIAMGGGGASFEMFGINGAAVNIGGAT